MTVVLVAVVLSLSFPAEAQRVYTKAGDGGIEDEKSKSYLKVNPTEDRSKDTRVNDKECLALRNTTNNIDANGNRKGYVADIVRPDLVNTGGMICPCAPKPGLWLERLVYCFASAPDGLIYNVMQDLIANMSVYYWQLYIPLIMFAVALFGWKMATGQLRSLPKETFLFATKLGGVVTFLAMFPVIHGQVLLMVEALASLVGNAMNGFSDICNLGPDARKPNLWAQWDCVFGKLLGVSVADPNNNMIGSGLFMGILGYIVSFFFLPGWGAAIVMTFVYMIFKLIGAALRAVNVYFMAIIAVSFLLLIAPLFVPLVLFGVTMQRFKGWFHMLIGYMLQPMMLMMFMGIMMVTLQYTIFEGPSSLFGVATNTNPKRAQHFTTQFAGNAGPGKDMTENMGKEELMQTNLSLNPEKTIAKPGSANSLQYGTKQGNLAVIPNMPVAPSGVDSGRDNIQAGIPVIRMKENIVNDLNNRPSAWEKIENFGSYLYQVFISMVTTSLMVFTLFTMLGKVGDIAHSLVGSGVNLSSAKMLGEDQAKKIGGVARQLLKTAIDVRKGGLASSSGGSTRELLSNALKAALGKR